MSSDAAHLDERGRMIQSVATIESAVNLFLSIHYFGDPKENFLSEVLEDDYFSFQLRIRILKKILKKYYPNIKFPWESLYKLQQFRNIVAHAPVQSDVYIVEHANAKHISESYYFYAGTKITTKKMFSDFTQVLATVREGVNSLPRVGIQKKNAKDLTEDDIKESFTR